MPAYLRVVDMDLWIHDGTTEALYPQPDDWTERDHASRTYWVAEQVAATCPNPLRTPVTEWVERANPDAETTNAWPTP